MRRAGRRSGGARSAVVCAWRRRRGVGACDRVRPALTNIRPRRLVAALAYWPSRRRPVGDGRRRSATRSTRAASSTRAVGYRRRRRTSSSRRRRPIRRRWSSARSGCSTCAGTAAKCGSSACTRSSSPRPRETPRAMGRFALELFEGPALIERVRFDFPLLGPPDRSTAAGRPRPRSRRSFARASASSSPRAGEARGSSSSIAPRTGAGRCRGRPPPRRRRPRGPRPAEPPRATPPRATPARAEPWTRLDARSRRVEVARFLEGRGV